jgi:hypothetical protein
MNYGLNGSGYFRYGDVAVTIATTALSRHYLQFILGQNPLNNIASDTDGLFLRGKPDVYELNRKLNEYITKEFGLKSYMELELEGPFPKGYFLKRKNYLLQREDGNIIKHGNSFKGTNKNIIFAYALEKLTKTVFDEPDKVGATIRDCFKLDERDIKDFIQRTSINRPLDEYDSGSCLQVSLARQMAHLHEIEVEAGDSIEYVKQESGYVIKDLAKLRKIDKRYYIKQVEGVLKRLDLRRTKIKVSKRLNGCKRCTRGESGYVYEGDGRVSKQTTLV